MTQQADADRWGGLDSTTPPADMVELEEPMLPEYVSGGRIAIITFNRPQTHNAPTTAMAARLTEFLDEVTASVTSARPGTSQGTSAIDEARHGPIYARLTHVRLLRCACSIPYPPIRREVASADFVTAR